MMWNENNSPPPPLQLALEVALEPTENRPLTMRPTLEDLEMFWFFFISVFLPTPRIYMFLIFSFSPYFLPPCQNDWPSLSECLVITTVYNPTPLLTIYGSLWWERIAAKKIPMERTFMRHFQFTYFLSVNNLCNHHVSAYALYIPFIQKESSHLIFYLPNYRCVMTSIINVDA